MKHVLFFKIVMIFFVFGAGTDTFNAKYKGHPKTAIANVLVNIAIATIVGIGICLLP